LRLYGPAADLDRVRPHEAGAVTEEIDAALFKRLGKGLRDTADHLLFAVNQRSPIELRLTHADVVDMSLVDLVQRVGGGHPQHFFGVQPRFGQVPPRSRSSTIATIIPAFRVGTVTLKPALPPPRISTS